MQCYQEMKFCCCYHRYWLEFLVDDRYFCKSSNLLEHHLCSHVLIWFVVILLLFECSNQFPDIRMFTNYRRTERRVETFNSVICSWEIFVNPFFNIPKTHWIKWIFSPCSSPHHANIVSVYVSNKESSFFFHFLVR